MPLRLVPCLVLLNMLVERYVNLLCVFYAFVCVAVVFILLTPNISPS